MHRTLLKKLIYKPRTGTLRVKWLKKLLKKKLKATIRFAKKNIYKKVLEDSS
jgi:phenylacetate-coenzyme A ligase PaaK-like adenylate-forming protein